MKKLKKQTIANLIMAGIILIIITAGILGVGHIRGWFDKTDDTQAVLTEVQGTVNMQRDGILYPVENETVLRAGDKLSCAPGATANICVGETVLTIGQNAELNISAPSTESFSAEITAGEVFAVVTEPVTLSFDTKEISFSDTTALISVRSGAQSISVFAGTVNEASAGQLLSWVGDDLSVEPLSIESLNDFAIKYIRLANKTQTLVFSNDDLDQLARDRQAALQELINSANKSTEETAEPSGENISESGETTAADESSAETDSSTKTDDSTGSQASSSAEATDKSSSEAVSSEETSSVETSEATATTEATTTTASAAGTETSSTATPTTAAPTTDAPTTAAPTTEAPTTAAPTTEAPTSAAPTEAPTTAAPTTEAPTDPPAPAKSTCTITIRCDTILNNMDDLDPGKVEFVPSDGTILAPVTVEFDEGETVFDVLNRVCNAAGIQIEYSWTPMYNSYYIEGINNLYEFDCGSESGWMYKVNGWFPNYGCSSYILADGDVIEWHYTCKGLGTDVGAPAW